MIMLWLKRSSDANVHKTMQLVSPEKHKKTDIL